MSEDEKNAELGKDKRLAHLLKTVQKEISEYAWQITSQINKLSEIGIALSAEHDLDKLLEMIVDEARHFTFADAGTLYIVENNHLKFRIMQNDTFRTRMGGATGNEITMPPVPLSKANVSAFAALTGETVNIADVYNAQGFDFTGPRKYDQATGYRSKSMLVVPMQNQDNEIIGVLQLLNAKDPKTGEVIPFADEFVALTESLASQAAVAITNAKLLHDMEVLFDSFVAVMATAIDERSPYTGGHIKKVATLGVLMCETINGINEGKWANVKFSKDQMKEMMIAGWMHDLGKITTPVHVVDKSMKLETIIDRVELVRTRFSLIEAVRRNEWLERKASLLQDPSSGETIRKEEEEFNAGTARLREDFEFVAKSNRGGEFMSDQAVERIRQIGAQTFSVNDKTERYLTEDEVENLIIRKGTLLDSERKLMQDHVVLTIKMLEKIPFTKKLARVTDYAGVHHECLDGSGYPKGLKGDQIPLQGRILGLVDFFEALTAADRPYKPAMPIEKAFGILKGEVEKGKLDKDLFELLVNGGVYEKFFNKFPRSNQQAPLEPASPKPPEQESSAALTRKLMENAIGRNPLEKVSS